MEFQIDKIVVNNRKRKLNEDKVKDLSESFKLLGQLEPITLTSQNGQYILLAGWHRLEAAKLLGWDKIDAQLFEGNELECELAEIDENLMRNDLTVLEQGEHLARRQELIGFSRGDNRFTIDRGVTVTPLKTTFEIAKEAGVSESSAQRRMRAARNIAPEVKDAIRDTEIANSTIQLLELARLSPEKQIEVAHSITNGALNIKEAKKEAIARKRELERQRNLEAQNSKNNIIDISLRANRLKLYKGDMLEILQELGRFDLFIADPPYGVTNYEWDKLNTEQWLDMVIPHLSDEYNIFWFCSPRFAADIEMIFRAKKIPIQSRIIWHRRNMSMGSVARNKFIDTWEMIFHAGNRELNFPLEWSDAWFDVQEFAVPQTNFTDKKLHPTQKPEGLIKRLIEFGSFAGDKIIDPFAGSGTTGLVCPEDRECTLIEKEESYTTIIEERLGIKRNGL